MVTRRCAAPGTVLDAPHHHPMLLAETAATPRRMPRPYATPQAMSLPAVPQPDSVCRPHPRPEFVPPRISTLRLEDLKDVGFDRRPV